MSRIGNKPIAVPAGVEVKVEGQHVTVKGPKGTLERDINPEITVKLEEGTLTFARSSEERFVGYRVQKQGNDLNLSLGYSHPVIYKAPTGISFDVPNPNTIIVKGINKEQVGQVAAEIRTKRPPEVYRGKGIKYAEEVIRRKVGKTGK